MMIKIIDDVDDSIIFLILDIYIFDFENGKIIFENNRILIIFI